MTEIQATWDDVQIKPKADYVSFIEPDKDTGVPVSQVFAVKNWTLTWRDEADYNDKSKTIKKVRFDCDVVGIDGKLTSKKIGTSSSRFINAIKPHLKDKSPSSIVFLDIMKVGRNESVNYVIKVVAPTLLDKEN